MKTNLLVTKILAGTTLALFSGLALPSAYAGSGSGVSIWRDQDKKAPAAVAPATTEKPACTDSRVVPVKQTMWTRNGGRGPVTTTFGEKRVCNSCAVSVASTKTTDRNSHSPKAAWASKATHDCGKSGCGVAVATGATAAPNS
jgi:hypothetical protein